MADSKYFGAVDSEDLPAEIKKRRDGYYSFIERSGKLAHWTRAMEFFYGYEGGSWLGRGVSVQHGGESGEVSLVKVNLLRSFLRHIHVLITGARPGYRSYARTGDYRARKEAELNDQIIEHDLTRGLESLFWRGVEIAQIFSEAYLVQTWDPGAGELYSSEQVPVFNDRGEPEFDERGYPVFRVEPVYEGGPSDKILTPLDVVRDFTREDADHKWFIVREPANKWDLAAEFPDKANEITSKSTGRSDNKYSSTSQRAVFGGLDSDQVYVWHFYHDRTPALPRGRYAMLCGDELLIDMDTLPYDELPVYSLIPHQEILSPFGNSENWDLLALQEVYDAIVSTLVTRVDGFGVPHYWVQKGSGLDVEDFRSMTLSESNTKPELINDFDLSKGLLDSAEFVRGVYEGLTGINEVVRGNAEAASSGAHAALVHAMAIQYNSGLQRSYGQWVERALSGRTKLYQRFATINRLLKISGQSFSNAVKQFSNRDISSVVGVTVETDSPMLRTMAGRKDLAKEWLDRGWIRTPEQHVEVFNTGKLSALTSRPRAQRDLIVWENEKLMVGEPVVGEECDDHDLHYQEHSCLLDDPEIRYNPQIAQVIREHNEWHVNTKKGLSATDPGRLLMLGQTPLPPPAPPMGPPEMGPPSMDGGAPPPNGNGAPPEQPIVPGISFNPAAEALSENMPMAPAMPINPETGEPLEV